MKKTVAILGAVLFSFVLSACGNGNEAACKNLVKKMEDCLGSGNALYDDSYCTASGEIDCDISDYFNCVSDAYGECVEGSFPNLDQNAVDACAPKSSCS